MEIVSDKMRKFSIIIPIYNVEDYIDKCVSSVLGQNYSNFEVILVNDGSTDNSAKKACEYTRRDARVQLINKENGGLSDARNVGLERATGDYIIFLDSDDYWKDGTLSSIENSLNNKESDIVVFGFDVDTYNPEGVLVSSRKVTSDSLYINKKNIISIKDKSFLGYAWNKAYKASLFTDDILFDKGVSYIEDVLFNAKIFSKAKNISIINQSLLHYVQRERPTLGRIYYDNIEELDLRANKAFNQILQSLKVSQDEIKTFLKQNIINRSLWTANIVSNTNTINSTLKRNKLNKVCQNILNERVSRRDAVGPVSTLLVWLMLKKHTGMIRFIENIKSRTWRRFLLDSTPAFIKEYVTYATSKDAPFANTDKTRRKIFVMLAADYGNLGDVAITYAQVCFLKKNFPDREIIQVPISKTYKWLKAMKNIITKKDIITIVGGGNIGDLYLDIERQRRFIIKLFRKYTIISFPQTIDFSRTKAGERELRRTKKAYSKNKNIMLLAREENSFNKMMELFPFAKVYLTPDIVLTLDKCQRRRRNGEVMTLCIRDDMESTAVGNQKDIIKNTFEDVGYSIKMRDTHIGNVRLDAQESRNELANIWFDFSKTGIVITDRLHGMIFCAITGTPCVAINNKNGKVKGVYERWLSRLNYIKLVDDYNILNLKKAVGEISELKVISKWHSLDDELLEILKGEIG